MKPVTIQAVSEGLRGFSPENLIRHLSDFIRLTSLSHACAPGRFQAHDAACETCREAIAQETDQLLEHSDRLAHRLLHVERPAPNQKTNADAQASTLRSFRIVIRHHIDILLAINDVMHLIRDGVIRAHQMQSAIGRFAEKIQFAGFMMEIIRERMAHRPTTHLRLNGGGQKGEQLNGTLDSMTAYENHQSLEMDRQAQDNPIENASAEARLVLEETCDILRSCRTQIETHFTDLKAGHALLTKFVQNGCSKSIQKSVDAMAKSREDRRRTFLSEVHTARQRHFLETSM